MAKRRAARPSPSDRVTAARPPLVKTSAAADELGRRIAIQVTQGRWDAAIRTLLDARAAEPAGYPASEDCPLTDPAIPMAASARRLLIKWGYRTVADLQRESDARLAEVHGPVLGPVDVAAIRTAIAIWRAVRGCILPESADNVEEIPPTWSGDERNGTPTIPAD